MSNMHSRRRDQGQAHVQHAYWEFCCESVRSKSVVVISLYWLAGLSPAVLCYFR